MTFGLSAPDSETLRIKVLEPLKKSGFKLFIFGSRAVGRHQPFSDIDILIERSESSDMQTFYEVREAIEEARFPVKVDFVFADELAESYRIRVHQEKIAI